MRKALLAAAAIVAFAASARTQGTEDDSPAMRLAREAVASERFALDVARTRIVWPESDPPDPPDGAEVVLIGVQYRTTLARFARTDGRAAASIVDSRWTWNFRDVELTEQLSVQRLEVADAEFATLWKASLLILAARLERTVPADDGTTPKFVDSKPLSEPHWIRVTVPGEAAPRFLGEESERGYDPDGVERWESVRIEALHWLFRRVVVGLTVRRDVRSDDAFAFFESEVASETGRFDRKQDAPRARIVEHALDVLGELGPASCLPTVEALDARLAAGTLGTPESESLRAAAIAARTKLRLRPKFDVDFATRALRADPLRDRPRVALSKWIRGRFRDADPRAYLRLLVEDLVCDDDVLRHETSVEASNLPRDFTSPGFHALLDDADPVMRFAAANACLLVDGRGDEPALVVLENLAKDESVRPPPTWDLADWTRYRAADLLVRADRWKPDAVRGRLDAPEATDGAWAKTLIDALGARDATPSREERVRIYARALDGAGWAVCVACNELLALTDTASFPRIKAALDRLGDAAPADVPAEALEALRVKLAAARDAVK